MKGFDNMKVFYNALQGFWSVGEFGCVVADNFTNEQDAQQWLNDKYGDTE